MLQRTTLAIVLSLIFAVIAPVHAQRTRPRLPTQRLLARYGLELAWSNQAVMNPTRDKVSHITVDEENVYVQSSSGSVTTFDSETGKQLWARQLGQRDSPQYPAVSNTDNVMVVSGITLYSIEKFGGDIQWKIDLPKVPSTSPAADETHVYIGALDGSVYAFSLRKLHELYSERMLPQYSRDALVWRFKTAKQITTPAISDGLVVNFASRDKSLYSISSTQSKMRWQFETDEPISAPMATAEGVILLASEDFNVYCIGLQNGQIRWDFVSGYPVRRAPRVIGQQVFVFPQRGGIYSLSLETGAEQWWRPGIEDFVGATNSRVFVSDYIGNIVMLARNDGHVVGALPLRDYKTRFGNDRTDRIYLATQSGLVVCIREIGHEFPVFHMHPERLPLLPDFAPEEAEEETSADPAAAADKP